MSRRPASWPRGMRWLSEVTDPPEFTAWLETVELARRLAPRRLDGWVVTVDRRGVAWTWCYSPERSPRDAFK